MPPVGVSVCFRGTLPVFLTSAPVTLRIRGWRERWRIHAVCQIRTDLLWNIMVIWFYPIKTTNWPKLFGILRFQGLKHLQQQPKKCALESLICSAKIQGWVRTDLSKPHISVAFVRRYVDLLALVKQGLFCHLESKVTQSICTSVQVDS